MAEDTHVSTETSHDQQRNIERYQCINNASPATIVDETSSITNSVVVVNDEQTFKKGEDISPFKKTDDCVEHKGDVEDESEDESDILEESPCGRWQKRREQVKQRDVPGIDVAYLAMDLEEGVEVVWNEVQFSERKNFKSNEEKIRAVFDNLTQLEHANIVKFHKYWTDVHSESPRVIFITEFMSSGSMSQFLKKTKKNQRFMSLKAWKRWCTQILSALSYLHSCYPPIIHGNLTCDTVFIQHNGLIKIGSVAPNAIHNHVKTYREEKRHIHYWAPEYGKTIEDLTTSIDIYSFGVCALEMAVLGFNGDGNAVVLNEKIKTALDMLENSVQKDFINSCLLEEHSLRPSTRELLFHTILFEVHSLRLLSAYRFVNNEELLVEGSTIIDEFMKNSSDDTYRDRLMAFVPSSAPNEVKTSMTYRQLNCLALDKFLEDVKNGVFPLTAFALPRARTNRPISPETVESVKSSETPEPPDTELRHITQISSTVTIDHNLYQISILLRLDDKMNRSLACELTTTDTAEVLVGELVTHGFISAKDVELVHTNIEKTLSVAAESQLSTCSSPVHGAKQTALIH